jgi:hypothetical protein
MVFDAANQKVMLFGGWDGRQPLGDTWTWDGSDWTEEGAAAPALAGRCC